MRLAWTSDIHLDCCDNATQREFAEECADRSDALLITGDITTGRETSLFTTFAARYGKPIYFVLGNHDYWHSSFAIVRAHYQQVVLVAHNLHFLDACGPIDLVPGVQLCGVSGWYDALLGDRNSSFALRDWWAIKDLDKLRVPYELGDGLRAEFQRQAYESAREATQKLGGAKAKHVFFATHVPPFAEAAWHLGKRSDDEALPYFTNKTLGLVLNAWAALHPAQSLTTLCGHSHSSGVYEAAHNHTVHTAAAEYGRPAIAYVYDLGSS